LPIYNIAGNNLMCLLVWLTHSDSYF